MLYKLHVLCKKKNNNKNIFFHIKNFLKFCKVIFIKISTNLFLWLVLWRRTYFLKSINLLSQNSSYFRFYSTIIPLVLYKQSHLVFVSVSIFSPYSPLFYSFSSHIRDMVDKLATKCCVLYSFSSQLKDVQAFCSYFCTVLYLHYFTCKLQNEGTTCLKMFKNYFLQIYSIPYTSMKFPFPNNLQDKKNKDKSWIHNNRTEM